MASPRLRKAALLAAVSVPVAFFMYAAVSGSCELWHARLLGDVARLAGAPDPEACHAVMEQVAAFNDSCQYRIEELDCG